MVASGVRMFARLVFPLDTYVSPPLASDPGLCAFWYWPDPDQLPEYLGGRTALKPHMPYGYLVEPD